MAHKVITCENCQNLFMVDLHDMDNTCPVCSWEMTLWDDEEDNPDDA